MSTRKLLPLLIAATTTPVGFAASANDNEPLEELIVSATRFEQKLNSTLSTAHVITAADIERQQAADLESVLRRVPGISTRNSGGRGSSSGLFIRGKSSSQVLVLIDGVRSASATTGATAIASIPVESIERIEIVMGPLSGIYGADAAGGVIQIFTKKGEKGLHANLNGAYRSYQTTDLGINVRGGNDVVGVSASVQDERNGGFDHIIDPLEGNPDHDEYEERSANVRLDIKLSDSADFRASYLLSDNRTDFDSAFGTPTSVYVSDGKQTVASVGVSWQANERLFLDASYGKNKDELVTPAFASDITTDRDTYTLLAQLAVGAKMSFSGGVDYYEENVITLDDFPETARDNTGVFAQWQYNGDLASASINLRNDDNSAYGENTTGGASIGLKVSSALEVVLSYGESFRAPSFNELYFPFYGNPSVLPEELKTFELSLRGNIADIDWRVSAYDTDANNLIAYDFNTFLAGNVSEAEMQGVELELQGQHLGWDWRLGLDYLDAYNSISNSYLNDRARLSGIVELARKFGAFDVLLDWEFEHGRHDGGMTLGGRGLLGLAVSYELVPGLLLKVSGDNLLDKNYVMNLASSTKPYRTEGRTGSIGFSWAL